MSSSQPPLQLQYKGKTRKDKAVLELFSGCGGLALGLEQAGLNCIGLFEIDKSAVSSLKLNRPNWNVVITDICNFSFKQFKGEVDVITGGFPCQPYSVSGKMAGLKDRRGGLFYEFLRAIEETQPKIFVGENVQGLVFHQKGETLAYMIEELRKIGYQVQYKVLNAFDYGVPQKRNRLFIVGVRNDIKPEFEFPCEQNIQYTLSDALKKGPLYSSDVDTSDGAEYSAIKRRIMELVPPGGSWKDLPLDIQKIYMGKMFEKEGSKVGVARRLSWDKPAYTLLCSPEQTTTDQCHPDYPRPLTLKEYARIQTFPDDWNFVGSKAQIYRQIGNAVPVALAKCMGMSITKFLEKIGRGKAT